ncbi:unnamed protein product [Cylindrotheca closterium]|uniref:Uncharacterized protein n=1 Tax=Cylindrotheca closterium TaxID=2856 RepID=A0AAD2CHJ7_9STRA|nr:unnamed protein product [Cylindrotheca closterium]
MKYIAFLLVSYFCVLSSAIGASNSMAESSISTSPISFNGDKVGHELFLRRRYLEEVQLPEEEEGKESQEGQPQLDGSNRLAFSETSSGRLVLIASGSLFGVILVYFFLHDYLRKACCSTTVIRSTIDEGDEEKDIQEPKRDMTTRTGSATVDDLSKSDDNSTDDSCDSPSVK